MLGEGGGYEDIWLAVLGPWVRIFGAEVRIFGRGWRITYGACGVSGVLKSMIYSPPVPFCGLRCHSGGKTAKVS